MSDSTTPDPNDPLALAELFSGGGEPWLPLLKPVVEAQPAAPTFIGPARGPSVVPVRELTFQALKPNPPHRWKVVAFGQNPYPRPESATGIAMFDNTFHNWADSTFGRVVSIRCIIKAAAMWKHGIPKKTPIADIRRLLKQHDTVQPPEWFQAMLTQGVLLLNAALTASSDGAYATDEHTAFWRPVVERIVEEILRAKSGPDVAEEDRGVVFAWWGVHARTLKGVVQRLQRRYPDVRVLHLDHANPAAQGDIFCNGNHFGQVNDALRAIGADEIDWLPSTGWAGTTAAGGPDAGAADRMGAFIASTMELHKLYLDRLASVKDEGLVLPAITGVAETPLMDFRAAVAPVSRQLPMIDPHVTLSHEFGKRQTDGAGGALTADEVAALHLYTCGSAFYQKINATLRDPDRSRITAYLPYLRLLLSALSRLPVRTEPLWRGVALDLRAQYPRGRTVTWWGVSSCTSELGVAHAFLGSRGRRTLFQVHPARAVGIRRFSAFTGEEEFILAPGTRLTVTDLTTERGGLSTVTLTELPEDRLVA